MNQYLFLGKEEQIYNTEEEIVKNLTLGEKMCNNEECKCENCTCGSSCNVQQKINVDVNNYGEKLCYH